MRFKSEAILLAAVIAFAFAVVSGAALAGYAFGHADGERAGYAVGAVDGKRAMFAGK